MFKLTAEADPNNYDVYMQLGLLNNFRNKKLAEKYFLNAIRIDSTKYEGTYALAMYYQNGKDYKRAIAQYKKMILQNPQEGQPFYNLGCIYFQIDSLQKAFSNFSIAIANAPTNADAHFMRGLCWELRKNKHEAIIDFQNATNLRSNFTDAENALKRLEVK
jgi:tetratricopeptide (TPR) repeat protein